jgi:superfamily II DNA or RNA helicase
MDEEGVMYSNFTGKENNKQRKRRAQNLKEDKIDALSAMNVLDEGFDLPSAKKAIILSSTGNEAQFIQRRGRVLRVPKKEGEENIASIYDFLVFPGDEDLDELEEYEESILEKELERIEKFAEIANNTEELQDTIKLKEKL